MTVLAIPERYRNGVVKLLKLSEGSFNQIISAFEGIGPKLFPDDLSTQVVSKIKGLSSEDLSEMIAAVMSLSSYRVQDDSTAQELADQVVEAATEAKLPIESDKERTTFRSPHQII